VRPDLDGLLEPAEMSRLAEVVVRRGGNVNRILAHAHASGLDVHQLNCTYYSAMGCDDERYLAARAIQLFAPGIPQLYYVGLLAGENDLDAVASANEGRAVNRHDYTADEIEAALRRPVVERVIELVRLRATHPAFGGALTVDVPDRSSLRLAWADGDERCVLHVDVRSGRMRITR
jgi:sucrose phosphorylase